jgi:HJR/Mrr/RecB family endonuclease
MNPTIVALDDSAPWLEGYARALEPKLLKRGVAFQAFLDDRDAAEFVARSPSSIVGYVQDLNRNPDVFPDSPEDFHGIQFLHAIIEVLTPGARVAVISGTLLNAAIRHLYRFSTVPVEFWMKHEVGSDTFFETLAAWLVPEPYPRATDSSGPKIVTSEGLLVTQVSEDLRRYLSKHPDWLHTMPPRQFEELVAELFREQGWEVELTSPTRDGGYDLIALRRIGSVQLKLLVEAKRYRPDRPVGVSIVRSLYATRYLTNASQVVIATSSHVSAEAKREFVRSIPHEIGILERDAILDWCAGSQSVAIGGFRGLGERP